MLVVQGRNVKSDLLKEAILVASKRAIVEICTIPAFKIWKSYQLDGLTYTNNEVVPDSNY